MAEPDVTADESQVRLPGRPDSARVTVALQAERPHQAPLSFSLRGVHAVWFSRGKGPASVERVPAGSETHLRVEIPDRLISTDHASLQRVLGSWLLEDKDSRNGTFVRGRRIDRHELSEGTVFEIGHTFCVFRAAAMEDPQPGASSLQPAFAARLRALERAAQSTLPIILRGETGTGKEVLARTVHRLSGRSGAFQALNCAAIPPALVESELFGYKKGAFTGALEDRPGIIRSADKGTLFLDEIGDLSPAAQGAFLRVLQESEVTPVGGTKPLRVDFRLVVATHRDLEARAKSEQFRPDLLARLAGFTLQLPPLRERFDDLGALIATLLERHAPGRELRFTQAAGRALFAYHWPLNVRELEKALRLAILSADGLIDLPHLPPEIEEAEPEQPAEVELSPADRERCDLIIRHLKELHGNVTAVAEAMKVARSQLQRWIRRYGIHPAEYR
jgi:DNA-binding NtrC family response regulator